MVNEVINYLNEIAIPFSKQYLYPDNLYKFYINLLLQIAGNEDY
jgi:hypothetical protein